MMKSFDHVPLKTFRYVIFFLIPIYMIGCWPAPYFHSWKGHIVTPSGEPLKDATVIMRNYHSCATVGGRSYQPPEVKSKRTDADGYFSIFTIGINLDYFFLIALCFGTEVEQYVCSKGKWQRAKDLQTNNGILQFDPTIAKSGDAYWFSGLPQDVKFECGQEPSPVQRKVPEPPAAVQKTRAGQADSGDVIRRPIRGLPADEWLEECDRTGKACRRVRISD